MSIPPEIRPIEGPAVWRDNELARREGWCIQLTDEEITEIHEALRDVDRRGLGMEEITAEDFPLPTLGGRLQSARDTLENGCGSLLLRGWPAAEHDLSANRRAFWGISRHLGTPVSQSAGGEKLFHVEDSGFQMGHPKARGPNTRRALNFHCDRCDVIGFLCVRKAKSGGESFLVSSAAVHNQILRLRPDLLPRLYEPFYYKTHNVDIANPDPYCYQPIFAVHKGKFVAYVLRVLIDRAYELPELPDMTTEQKAALDLLDTVCADENLHHRFLQEPGDMLFINNFTNFHSRSEFLDHPESARRRLLLRIWLSTPYSRALPPSFAGSFGKTAAGALRGGIHPPPG